NKVRSARNLSVTFIFSSVFSRLQRCGFFSDQTSQAAFLLLFFASGGQKPYLCAYYPKNVKKPNIAEQTARRILVLDGATGTLIQTLGLRETDFTFGDRGILRGLNDILCLTRPDAVASIHERYLQAGADIISTNTFNANAISLAEYGIA